MQVAEGFYDFCVPWRGYQTCWEICLTHSCHDLPGNTEILSTEPSNTWWTAHAGIDLQIPPCSGDLDHSHR